MNDHQLSDSRSPAEDNLQSPQAAAACLPIEAPAIRVTAMPADGNPYGDIFGGWLMALMDLAAGSVASRYCGGRAATVAVDAMSFHQPVSVGDEVSVYAAIKAVGRSSMKVQVEAWRRSRHGEDCGRVTEALFTFVAVDEDRRPRPVRSEVPLP